MTPVDAAGTHACAGGDRGLDAPAAGAPRVRERRQCSQKRQLQTQPTPHTSPGPSWRALLSIRSRKELPEAAARVLKAGGKLKDSEKKEIFELS